MGLNKYRLRHVRESTLQVNNMTMKTVLLKEDIPYTGAELSPNWMQRYSDCATDIVVGFIGPCDVPNHNLVDLEDQRAGYFIKAKSMVHVIVEHQGCSLDVAVLRQRLLVCLLCELLAGHGIGALRSGDDVFVDDRKLTVSIAAPATHSSMIHLGVNVDASDAPVPAIGLAELKVEPREFLVELIERYKSELAACAHATSKVRQIPAGGV